MKFYTHCAFSRCVMMFLSEDAENKSHVKVPFYKFRIFLPLRILISRLKLALVKPLLHLTRTIPYFHEFPLVISILLSFWFNGKHNTGPAWHIHPNLLNMLSVRLKWKKLPYIPRTLINSLQVKSWKIKTIRDKTSTFTMLCACIHPFIPDGGEKFFLIKFERRK